MYYVLSLGYNRINICLAKFYEPHSSRISGLASSSRDFVDAAAIYRCWSSVIEEQKYSVSRYEEDITCEGAQGVDWPIRISINIVGTLSTFHESHTWRVA